MRQLSHNYTRINKTKARRLYMAGDTIRICPVNMNPDNYYNYYCDIQKDSYATMYGDYFTFNASENTFESITASYQYYNCNSESGGYLAYYIRKDENKMVVIHRQRRFIDKYTCVDTQVKTVVQGFSFSQGDLLYYKKDNFNYLVISKSDLISEV